MRLRKNTSKIVLMEVIPMKRLILIDAAIFTLILCFCLPAFAGPPDKYRHESHKKYMDRERDHHKHDKKMIKKSHKFSNYSKYRGYRNRPYDKHRHYDHRVYKGHRYDYHGHWRSWYEWDKYVRRHPNIYKHGRYYHEHDHLMFRFCDPSTGGCVFFSIGR